MWQSIDMSALVGTALFGTGNTVVCLRAGVLHGRVVVKRMVTGPAQWPTSLATCSNILAPCAQINTDEVTAPTMMDFCHIAYPHTHHGSLAEWIVSQNAIQQRPSASQQAQIMIGILQAATSLMASCAGIDSIRADEIFLDGFLDPRVRLRHDVVVYSDLGSISDAALRWLAPEDPEVHQPCRCPGTWPSVAYRIGLLLYCLGAQVDDPYPQKSSDMVVLDLQREFQRVGKPVHPDLWQYNGPRPLRDLMEQCLSPNVALRPSLGQMMEALKSQVTDSE